MRYEPSGSLPPLQATADWRCPSRRRRALRRVARRAEAGYRALLAQHIPQGGGGGAA